MRNRAVRGRCVHAGMSNRVLGEVPKIRKSNPVQVAETLASQTIGGPSAGLLTDSSGTAPALTGKCTVLSY